MSKASATITADVVKHVASLASIPVTDVEVTNLQSAFEATLETVSNLKELDVSNVEPTHQVTGLENVLREDKVETSRTFTQAQALANAPAKHNGYFVVARVIDLGK
jgi:aspartyl-tRNA(Asn)/glutamyl-tRNA(Gln) amidotransferase subunit C